MLGDHSIHRGPWLFQELLSRKEMWKPSTTCHGAVCPDWKDRTEEGEGFWQPSWKSMPSANQMEQPPLWKRFFIWSFYEAGKPGEQNTTTHSPLIYSRWKTNLKKQKVFPHVPKATKRIKWNKYGMLGNKQIGESPWSPKTMQFHRTSIYQYPIEEKISDLSVHSNGIRCCSPVSNCTVSSGIGMFAKWIW